MQFDGGQLTCEFTVTSLNEDVDARGSCECIKSKYQRHSTVFVSKSVLFGSSTHSAGGSANQFLTKGVPVIGNVVFDGIPSSTRILNLLQIRGSNQNL